MTEQAAEVTEALGRLERAGVKLGAEWEIRRVLPRKGKDGPTPPGYRATLENHERFIIAWGLTLPEAIERVLQRAGVTG